MNKLCKPSHLPFISLAAGCLGLGLRIWLFLGGTDEKGLLLSGHPANALTFILTALVLGYLFLCVRPLVALDRYEDLFPNPRPAAFGCVAAAAGILWVCLRDLKVQRDAITLVCLFLGLLAVICLGVSAWFRWNRRRPVFWLSALVTVYLMVHLVSQYRLWSAQPQLQLYFFPLLASVFLMVRAYYATVLDARKGNRRWFVFTTQAALFCCILSVWSDSGIFYLAMALWMYTGTCSLHIPAETESEEA